MLDQFSNWLSLSSWPAGLLPVAVVLLGLLGSPHCVAMCGPLCAGVGHTGKKSLVFYHLGRLFAYLVLGGVAGAIGSTVLLENQGPLVMLASILVAFSFLVSGLRMLGFRRFSRPHLVTRVYSKGFLISQRFHKYIRAGLVGSLSGLLPCGWLYTFVLAAVATKSETWGAVVLFAFWLGTLPALSTATLLFAWARQWISKTGQVRLQNALGLLLVLYGLGIVFIRGNELYKPGSEYPRAVAPVCHSN